MQHNCVAPTASDIEALRGIAKDSKKPVIERVHAQYAHGHSLWAQGKRDEARKSWQRVHSLAELATSEHRKQRVLTGGPVRNGSNIEGFRWDTVAEQIEDITQRARTNVAGLEDITPLKASDPNTIARWTPWPIDRGTKEEVDSQKRAYDNAQIVRSTSCAQCSTPGPKLSSCSKCKLAYYCSPACQKANWKVHKPQCRTQGDIREGDVVRLLGQVARPELNGQYVLVLSRDASTEGHWQVQNRPLLGSASFCVSSDSMQHLLTH